MGGTFDAYEEGHVQNQDESAFRDSSTNTDSDRVLLTKRAIFHALCDLMDEMDFSKIGVGHILDRAGVSRSTFYRCFSDKYDVINWSFKRFKNIRVQDKEQFFSFETSLRVLLDHLRENQRFYAKALLYRGQNSLRDYITETNEEYMLGCWQEAHANETPSYLERSHITFAAAGSGSIIVQWVLDGCVQSADDVVEAVTSSLPDDVYATLY